MARRTDAPTPPRAADPDLPSEFEELATLSARDDVQGARAGALRGAVSIAHGRLVDSLVDEASVDRFDATGASWADVRLRDIRAVELVARDGTWRAVEVVGGRVGTFDATRARWDAVTLRGLRIDYLSLASATVSDLSIIDCEIGSLDVPDATLARVAFEGCRVDEMDTHGLRARDVDLRGAEVLAFTDARSLAGIWIGARQAEVHAVAWAGALGIRIAP